MNSKVYKSCTVPLCKNTSVKTPNKLFVYVPNKKSIRDVWLKLARRDPSVTKITTPLYFCEDHFDLQNDMENYMEYHVMGSVSQVRMKPETMPTKFECQPKQMKRTSNTKQKTYILRNRRKTKIKEQNKSLQDGTDVVENLELKVNSSDNCSEVSNNRVSVTLETDIQEADKISDKSTQADIKPSSRSIAVQTESLTTSSMEQDTQSVSTLSTGFELNKYSKVATHPIHSIEVLIKRENSSDSES